MQVTAEAKSPGSGGSGALSLWSLTVVLPSLPVIPSGDKGMTKGPSPQRGLSNTLAAPRPGWELHFPGNGALGTRAERAGLSAAVMATPEAAATETRGGSAPGHRRGPRPPSEPQAQAPPPPEAPPWPRRGASVP